MIFFIMKGSLYHLVLLSEKKINHFWVRPEFEFYKILKRNVQAYPNWLRSLINSYSCVKEKYSDLTVI